MADRHIVSFTDPAYAPIALAAHQNLAEYLTVQNSPVLFGCRTGICGTCLIELIEVTGQLPPPTPEEREIIETVAPDRPHARLACQLDLTANIEIRRL